MGYDAEISDIIHGRYRVAIMLGVVQSQNYL
jgi:hypothetical protein